jgi:hypothetical protein
MSTSRIVDDIESNRDPLTGETGSHPIGTGIGASAAGTIGAVVGAFAGPLGALAGAAIGATAGGAAGHAAAEAANPTYERIETTMERDFGARPYAKSSPYVAYAPAYQYGASIHDKYGYRQWDDSMEAEVRDGWNASKNAANMSYENAREAIRDAWHAAERAMPGDANGDGR